MNGFSTFNVIGDLGLGRADREMNHACAPLLEFSPSQIDANGGRGRWAVRLPRGNDELVSFFKAILVLPNVEPSITKASNDI